MTDASAPHFMIIACPSCATKFDVGAVAFPPAGRKVKCASCGHIWRHGATAAPAPVVEPVPAEPEAAPEVEAAEVAAVADAPEAAKPDDAPPEMIWAGSDIPRRRPGRGTYAAVAVASFAVVLSGGLVFRQEVANAIPAMSSIYAAIGLPVDTTGLDLTIEAQTMESNESAGATTLVVTGVVANVTSEDRPVPRIRATLLAQDKSELHSWTFDAGVTTLKPGETHSFRQELAQPPADTYQVFAHFADAGE